MAPLVHDIVSPAAVRSMVVLLLHSAAGSGAEAAPAAGEVRRNTTFRQLNLISDVPGAARMRDANLVNPWGLAAGPSTPVSVADHGSDRATVYSGGQAGKPVEIVPLVVSIPGGGAPTGQVFNDTASFVLSRRGKSGPAQFIFAGENGDISGWNSSGDPGTAVLAAHAADAVYRGLALLHADGGPLLLAANFRANRIDVFDGRFRRVRSAHLFRSAGIPTGYAPFNVAVFGQQVFVTYAKQDADRSGTLVGPGHGFVNVFDQDGRLLRHFARRGVLNSPWGMAIAPEGFGMFAGDLLIGNVGDGRIYAFNRWTGTLRGTLRRPNGSPVRIDGLCGLLPGNSQSGGTNAVWFSAGSHGEAHGLLGVLRPSETD